MSMELFWLALPKLLNGLWLTLLLTLTSVIIGFHLGLLLAVMRLSANRAVAGFAKGYSAVFRGTPLLVQLFLFYYGLGQIPFVQTNPVLWWIIGNGTHCAVLALALNTAAYTSEILRGGLLSVPTGLVEAARACGMSRLLCFRRITFPLAIRQALPAYGNELLLLVKGTSLASTVTVLEMTGQAKRLMSQTFAILEVFTIAGAFYLLVNLVLISLVHLLEAHLNRHRIR
ncbi:octopine/nopaline transport system permease protein [Rhizobium sp. RU20A]|uniref:ABC transporter permease n=1 Tax=Rhizobium sp. RU20A TaxID=1907412 RepID=UPI000954578C|nr:ABC transporter permease subunit [Rhizobium sp. RU20A]SIQ94845.1 octopine/nopaline transport system permease protein [Rhizobium sp. RU20A]